MTSTLPPLAVSPLEIASRYVGVRETSRNQAPEIALFWNDTGYPQGDENREPWCAAFVCYCLAEAARQGWRPKVKALPREAAVRYFLDWCRGRYGVDVWANDGRRLPMAGDLTVFLPRLSHIGSLRVWLAERCTPSRGILTRAAAARETGLPTSEGALVPRVVCALSFLRVICSLV